MKHESGFILLTTLIFIFVMTLIVLGDRRQLIAHRQMENLFHHDGAVFASAEAGLWQAIHTLSNDPISLPELPMTPQITIKNRHTDLCGNEVVDIESVAEDEGDRVVLNSKDIFARVPVAKGCKPIPPHQILWWHVA